jgi:dTDP-glucose pyrophosphorylase
MSGFSLHLVYKGTSIKNALKQLNQLAQDNILFVVNIDNKFVGTLTDGDVRRGLLQGILIDAPIDGIIQPNPRYIRKGDNNIENIINFRKNNFRIIPIIDEYDEVVDVINFRKIWSYLPIDAVLMAGGKGQRLMPLTANLPKPLLKVGEKPIIEHNINRLSYYGIKDLWISINYLGELIEKYFGDGKEKDLNISYVQEDLPLGTIGSISKINDFKHDYILVSNSDILTNLDYEQFFLEFIKSGSDLGVVTIPYQVNIPYAVLETINSNVVDFKEKPTYTYYSNGGIYLFKRDILNYIPFNSHFNATDLMEVLIKDNRKIFSYPLIGYWLDIGSPQDYERANTDILNIKF